MQPDELKRAIEGRRARVSVIGQGYVGLPLAIEAAKVGFPTTGVDVDPRRVERLAQAESYILDVSSEELGKALASGAYYPTMDFSVLQATDVVVICVPTPLRKTKDPDVSFILNAVEQIKAHLHEGMLLILESTTYPGTTNELIADVVEGEGFQVGRDVFVCFSPERVDPGNPMFHTNNMPKIVGGVTSVCTEMGAAFYSKLTTSVVPVSSARVAELVKLVENTFRAVNIGLVNELALLSERMDINIWEAIDAAATKPFGFMAFYPGPGIGGHCIPLDPMYLSWKAKTHDFYNKFIELASDVNGNMPRHVLRIVAEALNLRSKPVAGSRILLLGMAYKRDIDDLRESPALEVYRLLVDQGARVDYADPYVESFREGDIVVQRIDLSPGVVQRYDCVVLTTNHSAFDYQQIADEADLIVDTRNAFRNIDSPHILRLGTKIPSPADWRAIQPTRHLADQLID